MDISFSRGVVTIFQRRWRRLSAQDLQPWSYTIYHEPYQYKINLNIQQYRHIDVALPRWRFIDPC